MQKIHPNKASLFPDVSEPRIARGPADWKAPPLHPAIGAALSPPLCDAHRAFPALRQSPPRLRRREQNGPPSPFLAARLIPQRTEAAPGRQPLREPVSQTPSSPFSYSSVPPINRGCFAFSTRFALLDSISTLLTITIHHNASPKTGISCE